MEKKYLLISLFLLMELLHADLLCVHSYPVNQGGNLYVHCATMQSQSECTANTSDQDANFIMQYPEYPEKTLQEFKEPITTSQDGQFTISIFMNDKVYFNSYNYSATITCFNPLDNSTNQTSFTFTPEGYSSNAGWVIGVFLWLKNEFLILFAIFILSLFALALALMFLRSMGFGR